MYASSSKMRIFLISAVLLAAALLTPRIVNGNRNYTLLFLLYLVVIISIVFLRWPVLGLIAIILGGMFVHVVGPSGLNAAVIGVALMLGLWSLKMIAEQRKIKLIISRTTIPLIIFMLISILSFGMGQLSWFFHVRCLNSYPGFFITQLAIRINRSSIFFVTSK